jgi:hypothetical protein
MQVHPGGGATVVKILKAPGFFGLTEPVAGERDYLVSTRALGPARYFAMAKRPLRQLLGENVDATVELLEYMSAAFCVTARFEASRLFPPEALLANLLLAYLDVAPEWYDGSWRIALKRTQADLANAIGASERLVNRRITEWQDGGVLEKKNARFTIHQRESLETIAGDLVGSLVFVGKMSPTGLSSIID